MKHAFLLLVLSWVLLRFVLLGLAWYGDRGPGSEARILRHFTTEDIGKGKEYARTGFGAKIAAPLVSVGVILLFMHLGFFTRFFAWCETVMGGGNWLPHLLFALGFLALLELLSVPFSYYLGHVCETRMGFSTMSAGGWVVRHLKLLLIGWVVTLAGLAFVLWLFRTFPRGWPLVVPFGMMAFEAVMIVIFPLVITPLFYTQEPLPEGPLRQRILAIADQAGVPVEGIFQIDESKYSKHTNAYFTGLFSKKRIVLFDTLIKSHTQDETALIFAHEVGHWKHDHMLIGLSLGLLGTLVACLALWWGFPFFRGESWFGLGELASARNLPFFYVLSIMLNLWGAPIEAQISQHFERQADRASLELTGLKQVFIDAEVRLARDNRSDLLPHPWRVFWLYSHPPAIDRIAMAEEFTPSAKAP